MGSGKSQNHPSNNITKKKKKTMKMKQTTYLKNPNIETKFKKKPTIAHGKNIMKKKEEEEVVEMTDVIHELADSINKENASSQTEPATASRQQSFFLDDYQSANGVQLSSLELQSIKETSFVELGQDVKSLGKHVKAAFGKSWKQVLCEGVLEEGEVDPGSPAVLILSTSALRSIEFLRSVRSLTRECRAVKLFSKHMKVEEQVALLKNRVNFASGTPNRVKKLIDIEALGLSRLKMIVLDMHKDVKGYSLLTLPQVRDEFWDLYKNYFHHRLVQGDLRICLFGPIPNDNELKGKRKKRVRDE